MAKGNDQSPRFQNGYGPRAVIEVGKREEIAIHKKGPLKKKKNGRMGASSRTGKKKTRN